MLRSVRAGDVALDDVLAQLQEIVAQLDATLRAADLPPEGDWDRVDAFLLDAHLSAWDRATGHP